MPHLGGEYSCSNLSSKEEPMREKIKGELHVISWKEIARPLGRFKGLKRFKGIPEEVVV